MVDIDAYHLTRPEDEPTSMGDEDIRHWTSKCVCEICQQRQEDGLESRRVPLFIDFGSAEKTGTFSDHELLLLPSRVVAYIFRTRSWGELNAVEQEAQGTNASRKCPYPKLDGASL